MPRDATPRRTTAVPDAGYELVRHLATGGMAELFIALRRGDLGGRHVVLKRILGEHARNPQFVTMFLDEARLASRINHANVARVLDVGRTGETYYYTMEYVHGENARDLLQRAGQRKTRIPDAATVTVIAAAAAGLHAAHEQRDRHGRSLEVVHRDVSPSNVMIAYDGTAKVVDFGVAKAADRMTETRSGAIKGKIAYLSPEQCLFRDLDRRSDVFSLGIVAWEMLTQRRLFKRASDYETMRAIIEEELPAPSVAEPSVTAAFDRVILRALARDPAQRYPTAAAFAHELEEVARGRGLVLGPAAVAPTLASLFGAPPLPWLESAGEQTAVLALGDIDVIDISGIDAEPSAPAVETEAGAVPPTGPRSAPAPIAVGPTVPAPVSAPAAVSVSAPAPVAEPVSVSGSAPVSVSEPVSVSAPAPAPVPAPVPVHGPVSVSVPGWPIAAPPAPPRRAITIGVVAATAIAIALAITIASTGSSSRDGAAAIATTDGPAPTTAIADAPPPSARPGAALANDAGAAAGTPAVAAAAGAAVDPAAAAKRDEARVEAIDGARTAAKRARWAAASSLCTAGLDRWPGDVELMTVCAKASCALGKKSLARLYLGRLPARRRPAIEQLCIDHGTFRSSTECTDDPTSCR